MRQAPITRVPMEIFARGQGHVSVSGGGVDGVVGLRELEVADGETVWLNFHTTAGDYGAGQFYGVTAGTYIDNDGTVIVPTGGDGSAAWLRVWDHVKAHVGWFGAKCQPELPTGPDDYLPVKKCFDLFTNGRTTGSGAGGDTIQTGVIDVGPGFNFSQPLIYGGNNAAGFTLKGHIGASRGGQEKSLLRYIGPKTLGTIIFYGANQFAIDDINTLPGLALNGIMVIADNTYNNVEAGGDHTTTHAITAGANVVVTPSGSTPAQKTYYLQPGVMLGVDAGGPNFEIIYITAVDTVAGTFTADFTKDHASGVLLGGGTPSSGARVNRCRLLCPSSPVYTKLTAAAPGPGSKTYVVADITGILVGHPVRIGHGLYQEIVYPTAVNVGAKSFTATSNFSHESDERVMYPTSSILFGNRLLGTVQVSEVAMYDTHFQGDALVLVDGTNQSKCYAGIRQMWGGNVKNFTLHTMWVSHLKVGFAFEQTSGQYVISGGCSGVIEDTIFYAPAATIMVQGWEDESAALWLVGHTGGQATFTGCTMQGQVPLPAFIPGALPATQDETIHWGGKLTFIGCEIVNGRIYGTTLPIIVSTGIDSDAGWFSSAVTLIGCYIAGVTQANLKNLVRRSPGDTTDVITTGTGRFVMLNCTGGDIRMSTITQLPNIIPRQIYWDGTATYDPPSIAANTAGTIQTMAVSGAVLGDLVDVSFSLNLGEMLLRAWASAADTVSYQFRNPTAAPIDLGSGTVKVRVKK